jgi:hypothetical protein
MQGVVSGLSCCSSTNGGVTPRNQTLSVITGIRAIRVKTHDFIRLQNQELSVLLSQIPQKHQWLPAIGVRPQRWHWPAGALWKGLENQTVAGLVKLISHVDGRLI